MIITAMVRKKPNMKPHDISKTSERLISRTLSNVWIGLTLACAAMLFIPASDNHKITDQQKILLLSASERNELSNIEAGGLTREPLDINALINLTQLASANSDHAGQENFAKLAAARSARNYAAQSNLIDMLIEQKQFAEAIVHMDGLHHQGSHKIRSILPPSCDFRYEFLDGIKTLPSLV